MAELKLKGKTVVTQTGTSNPVLDSGVTIPAAGITGTLGSGVVFPAGHIVKTTYVGLESVGGSSVSTAVSTFNDTALEIGHTTALSSADSYLCYEFYSSSAQVDSDNTFASLDVTMRTVQNSTYTVGETIAVATATNAAQYRWKTQYGSQLPIFVKLYCGLESGMGMPETKSSWAAGDTLYFRLFMKMSSGAFYVVIANALYSLSITEIAR